MSYMSCPGALTRRHPSFTLALAPAPVLALALALALIPMTLTLSDPQFALRLAAAGEVKITVGRPSKHWLPLVKVTLTLTNPDQPQTLTPTLTRT